jgi:hypothetical protein
MQIERNILSDDFIDIDICVCSALYVYGSSILQKKVPYSVAHNDEFLQKL